MKHSHSFLVFINALHEIFVNVEASVPLGA